MSSQISSVQYTEFDNSHYNRWEHSVSCSKYGSLFCYFLFQVKCLTRTYQLFQSYFQIPLVVRDTELTHFMMERERERDSQTSCANMRKDNGHFPQLHIFTLSFS